MKGLGALPSVEITSTPVPRGGDRVDHIQPRTRLITWPMVYAGATHGEYLDVSRALAETFGSTQAQPGTLVVARPDGTARQIRCRYQDGWEESGGAGSGIRWDTVAMTLLAPSPWWTDTEPVVITRQGAAGGVDFLDDYPSVSSSQTLGATTVVNPGSVETWPDWTITGPASQITATNNTTGQTWTLTPSTVLGAGVNLADGQTITISGDPITVTGPGASPWEPAIDWANGDLWPLLPGANDITFTVSGDGTNTAISAQFYPRYRTA
ncbi:MAG TPA: hypothetical protein VFM01_14120 [Nakamurella sp.]|nr:hypothetical protein [Nakamurella sp.]